MRLPASVLGSLRLGLGATALLAGGCDAEQPRELEPVSALAPAVEESAYDAPEVAAEVVAVLERAAAQAPRPARRAARELVAVTAPVAQELSEDLTAFVPFAEEPGNARPIRPRIRTRVRPLPRTEPRSEPRAVEVGSRWSTPPSPKWDGGGCPACGRG